MRSRATSIEDGSRRSVLMGTHQIRRRLDVEGDDLRTLLRPQGGRSATHSRGRAHDDHLLALVLHHILHAMPSLVLPGASIPRLSIATRIRPGLETVSGRETPDRLIPRNDKSFIIFGLIGYRRRAAG